MVTALDDVVGNLTQKLKDVGIYENTIIIFSSDNGGILGFGGNKPLKGKFSYIGCTVYIDDKNGGNCDYKLVTILTLKLRL